MFYDKLKSMNDIKKAKSLLNEGFNMVLVKNDEVITSKLDGIKPLFNILYENTNVEGYSIADKIVGKAQSMLIVKANIKEVYARVISKEAIKILTKYNIPYSYETLTEHIINRKKTDLCPMEKAVKDIDDIEKAYVAIKLKLDELKRESN